MTSPTPDIPPATGTAQPAGEPTSPPAPVATIPAPAAPPTPPSAPVPVTAVPPVAPATGTAEHGYPPNTPIVEMTTEQQLAYWRHQSRRHEDRVKAMGDYDQLKTTAAEYQKLVEASRTEQERAVAAAREQGRSEALAETGGRLVEAHLRAAVTGRLTIEQVDALLAGLDRTRFLTTAGDVDTSKVTAFITAVIAPTVVAPAPQPVAPAAPATGIGTGEPQRQVPDYGQGRREVTTPSGLEAGRAAARARFGKTLSTLPPT